MSITIKTDAVSSNQNLKYAVRDNLLANFATSSSNVDGILLFSLDDKTSFTKQSTPIDGDNLINLANANPSLAYFKAASAIGDVVWDNTAKAIDFSAVGAGINGVRSNSGWIANEFNGNSKYFILTSYVFIPEPEDWHSKSGGLVDFASTISSPNSEVQTEVLGALSFVHHPTEANEYQIWGRFSKGTDASGSYTTLPFSVNASDINFPFGMFAQVSLVRDSSGTYLYIISNKGVIKQKWSGSDNTGKDVTTAGGQVTWGRGGAFPSALTCKYKISRGFIINLNKNSISDINVFLKADWDRQVARGRIA